MKKTGKMPPFMVKGGKKDEGKDMKGGKYPPKKGPKK